MNREGKKCFLYSRVSTEMQVDGYSLEAQKSVLKKFAEREEMQIIEYYEDAGKSGKSIEGRPAFKKMLSDIENGQSVDYILVYKLSRFGRNAADILNSLEFIQTFDVNLICIEEGIDSSQTSGKLLISVLSAVAEIERENILEQTMNGRREKARQGLWNGGPAPYGYTLKDNRLYINEDEAELVRLIYDKYVNTNIGYSGIAKYLNLQGIKKVVRTDRMIEEWSAHFVNLILENPVYCGKIAYGRRTLEKVKGKKNEYKRINATDYITVDGLHEPLVSEEVWNKAQEKRQTTGKKFASKYGKDRTHLLTGLLKCPVCGGPMYANRHCWTKKDGTYKEVGYYVCGKNKHDRGKFCEYKADLKKSVIEPLVIEAVKEIVSQKYFAEAIKSRIGNLNNNDEIDREIKNFEVKLGEVELNKARLEKEIDTLPFDTKFRERKLRDLNARLDGMYETIAELEELIADANLCKKAMEEEAVTLENIYQILLNFSEFFDIIDEDERKNLLCYLIKEIQLNPHWEKKSPLKWIEFNFPIYRNGEEIRKFLCEGNFNVETLVHLSKKSQTSHIEVDVEFGEGEGLFSLKKVKQRAEARKPKEKVTYKMIQDYIEKTYGFKVHTAYIAEVKRDLGLPMYDAPNAVEELKRPRAHPTLKMVEAIKETLKHFEII